MEVSIQSQLKENLYSILLGVLCFVIYEVFKLGKELIFNCYSSKFSEKMAKKEYKVIKNPIYLKNNKKIYTIMTIIFDIIYFLLLSLIFPIFIYIINGGVFRWYIFAFAFLGFVLPKSLIGKPLKALYEHINYYFKVVILYLTLPINKIIYIMKKKLEQKKNKIENNKNEKKKNTILSFGK